MERTVLLGITLILVSNTFSLPAFSQAIAESVTLGASTSIAAGKAGSALGSALNRSSKQLGGHLQQQLSESHPTSARESETALLPKSQSNDISKVNQPQSGALVVSIQGAEPNCRQEQSSPQQEKANTATPSTSCISPNASVKPESTNYKSVVTVTFPH
jgi:hypothetical protein